jgi:catalase
MAKRVAAGLRLGHEIEPAATTVPARCEIKPSPALSIIGKDPHTLKGRVIGVLVSDGADPGLIEALRRAVQKEGAKLKIVAPHVGGAKTCDGKLLEADQQLAGAPSIFFDAVAVVVSEAGPASWREKPPRSISCQRRSITSR